LGSTPTYALPYPELTDAADVPTDMHELATAIEAALAIVKSTGAIPGEVKMWPGAAVPAVATYGLWVWADGAVYSSTTYPKAAAAIANAWRTAHGQADPGAGNFRVPDLRGVLAAGLDAMPGGARANRMTRAVAITIAARTGEEYHTITLPEAPAHAHVVTDPGHGHGVTDPKHAHAINDPTHAHNVPAGWNANAGNGGNPISKDDYQAEVATRAAATGISVVAGATGVAVVANVAGVTLQNAGGGGAHENVPPTVFVPWIVKLD
jgi:microcystin-dependent protein